MEKEHVHQADWQHISPEHSLDTQMASSMPPPFHPTANPLDAGLGTASREGLYEPEGDTERALLGDTPLEDKGTTTKAETPSLALEDEVLADLVTTGASESTALQDDKRSLERGVDASEKLAHTDLERIKQYLDSFIIVGNQKGLPPALLAAIASRESRAGNTLDTEGYGDHGNGYGIMQVDKRYHEIADQDGPGGVVHVEQAADILLAMLEKVKAKFPNWSQAQQLRGAVAAYNFGHSNVQTWEGLDVGTTMNDYSADTWARARYYASLEIFNGTGDIPLANLAVSEKTVAATTPVRPSVPTGRLIAQSVGKGGTNHIDDIQAVLDQMWVLGIITENESIDTSPMAVEAYVIRYQELTFWGKADGRIDPQGKTEDNLIKGIMDKPKRKPQPPPKAKEQVEIGLSSHANTAPHPEKSRTTELIESYWALLKGLPATEEGAASLLDRGNTFAAQAFADLVRLERWDMLYALHQHLWFFDTDWMAREITHRLSEHELASVPEAVRRRLWTEMERGWTGSEEYELMDKIKRTEGKGSKIPSEKSDKTGAGSDLSLIMNPDDWRTQSPSPTAENQQWEDSESGWENCKYVAEKMVYRHLYEDLPKDFKRTLVINAPAGKYDYVVGATGEHEYLSVLREDKSQVRRIVPKQRKESILEEASSAEAAIDYLSSYVAQGIPVVVGVDHTYNRSLEEEDKKTSSQNTFGYNEGTTDHFVTIVGQGINEEGKRFFKFFDPGTQKASEGTSTENYLIEEESMVFRGWQPWKWGKVKYSLSMVILFKKDLTNYDSFIKENEGLLDDLKEDFNEKKGDFSYLK